MTEQFIGYIVSIDCENGLGIYQGQISHVDPKVQTLTLKKAFRNGIPEQSKEIVLKARDIKNISIIERAQETDETNVSASTVAVTRPLAKRPGRSISESIATGKGIQLRESPRKHEETNGRNNTLGFFAVLEGRKSPNKKDRRHKLSEKDEACFGTPIDNFLHHDFDFEKNLALFDKQAVFDEIAAQRPDLVRQTDVRRVQKYRHDENILATTPAKYRQLIVPSPGSKEYVTDEGLVIPSITADVRRQLLMAAERRGLTIERQTEMMGRAVAEMALQLLGGGHRLNPRNSHQWPTVVALCGSHRQGVVGINSARQLASHGVKTIVYLLDSANLSPLVTTELTLYKLTHNAIITNTNDLPSGPVDLILGALVGDVGAVPTMLSTPYLAAIKWANDNRAAVMALDPPASSTPGLNTKFSLLPLLPLAHRPENGKLYLCNLACPVQVFRDVGIKYTSPFGPKFVIPLHPNEA
ncbi:Enhancer of mRNA-decapping protein 3 [Gryllus bimaculatus]|nr:Enhancer of mRNA-decapping protein 3 [Gryllus bimaculatus]